MRLPLIKLAHMSKWDQYVILTLVLADKASIQLSLPCIKIVNSWFSGFRLITTITSKASYSSSSSVKVNKNLSFSKSDQLNEQISKSQGNCIFLKVRKCYVEAKLILVMPKLVFNEIPCLFNKHILLKVHGTQETVVNLYDVN